MTIKEVEKVLKRYDPLLRIRWSQERERWSVERRVLHGRFNLDRPYDVDSDRYYHIRTGCIPVGYLPPRSEFFSGEVEEILRNLSEGDIWKHGGADRMNDLMDESYEQARSYVDSQIAQENRDLAGEAYESLAWKEKRRIVAGMSV